MALGRRRGVILIEPDINPVTRRFSLPNIANYPPLPQARLAGQLQGEVEIIDLRIAGERRRLLDRVRRDPPALAGISLTFTSNGNEAIEVAAAIRSASPGTTIVFGGTAPSEDPASFWDSAADLICFRNGDAAFAALAAEIRESGPGSGPIPRLFPPGGWALDSSTRGHPRRRWRACDPAPGIFSPNVTGASTSRGSGPPGWGRRAKAARTTALSAPSGRRMAGR
jgi:radical SAM superfamily enzyme YgiQ (UPF0313 family)